MPEQTVPSEVFEAHMRERSKFADRLAIECYKLLEPKLQEVAEQLNNGLEITKFASGLENRVAISVGMRLNARRTPLTETEE